MSSSPCKEVAVVSRIVGRNTASTTGLNLLNIQLETSLNPRSSPLSKFKEHFQTKPEVQNLTFGDYPFLENTWRSGTSKLSYVKIRTTSPASSTACAPPSWACPSSFSRVTSTPPLVLLFILRRKTSIIYFCELINNVQIQTNNCLLMTMKSV